MTLEDACVLAKEIVIGQDWPCMVFGDPHGSYVEVYLGLMPTQTNLEIFRLVVAKGFNHKMMLGNKLRIS